MAFTTGQTTSCYVKEEVTDNVLIVPAGTDVLPVIADPGLSQLKNLVESLERVDSYSLVNLLALRYAAGTFSLPFYMKRTGVVDTAIASIDCILKNAMGRKTTNAGTSIVYNLYRTSDTLLTFSLFIKIGGIVLQASGCFINDIAFPIVADTTEAAIFRATASGQAKRVFWEGATTITEDLSVTNAGLTQAKVALTDLAPNDGSSVYGKFTVGGYITAGALTTSHKITVIDPATGKITVTPAFGSNQVSGSSLRGWTPAASVSGTPISGHKGLLTYDAINYAAILAATPHLTSPRRVITEMKNDIDYSSQDAWEGRRSMMIEGVRAYFDPVGTPKQDLFFALENQATSKAVVMNVGNVNGLKWQLNCPQCITKEPRLAGEGIVTLEQIQQAVASGTLDDEFNIVSF